MLIQKMNLAHEVKQKKYLSKNLLSYILSVREDEH